VVNDHELCLFGQLGLGHQGIEPDNIQGREGHRLDLASIVQDRIAETERGLASRAVHLILADGKVRVDGPIRRAGTAEYIAAWCNHAEVRVERIVGQQVAEELTARCGVAAAHFGELGQRDQELARPFDQEGMIEGDQAGQPQRLGLDIGSG